MFDMKNDFQNKEKTKFRPLIWIMAGCILILLPIFIFWTSDNISRQERAIERLLMDKGEDKIKNVENSALWMIWGQMNYEFAGPNRYGQELNPNPLQIPIEINTRTPDTSYIIITDLDGNITNHSDTDQIGKNYGHNIDYPSLINFGGLNKRETRDKNGNKIFEVYRIFWPKLAPKTSRDSRRNPQNRYSRLPVQRIPGFPEEGTRIIFIGLDRTHIDAQSNEDKREIIKRGIFLLLIGFAGISLLFLVQAYRTAQSSLSRIKALSDNIVENMPIGLIVLDTDSVIASFNNTAETLLHISGENIVGKPVEEKIPKQLIELINELQQNKKNIVKELKIDLDSREKIYLDINMSILEDNSGTLLGYIILFRDLSEVQELKKEVERSTRLASIGRLAAGVAHEIRNPLSSIKGFATYFGERYKDVPEDKDTAQIMVNEVERLNRVISQLLEFARPVNINKKTLDIKTVINHSAKIVERNASEKDIKVQVNIPSGTPHIAVDSDRINQVFLNLFLNSIEAMDSGGELSVTVNYDSDAGMMKIRVYDTGRGIAPDDIGHVFDPYFTTKQSGTGLGLAIVHRIIESHNGEIKVESNPGAGTSVTISLPLD